jgi:ferrous iron transport protein B
MTRLRIALGGNPNTGKTTLFNRLTGSSARVGNYPGVTVELSRGSMALPGHGEVEVIDVPGSYSLVARSRDEQVAIDCLLGLGAEPRPDVVVFCVDATNLSRNLYLVLQAQELGLRCVVALTMVDEAGRTLMPPAELERTLGVRVVPLNVRLGHGLAELADAIAQSVTHTPAPALRFTPSAALAERIGRVRAALPSHWPSSDGLALWALMSVTEGDDLDVPAELRAAVLAAVPDEPTGKAVDDECVQSRYAFLDQFLPAPIPRATRHPRTARLDHVLIHPVWGFLVFILVNLALFQALFSWSAPAIELIEGLFASLQSVVGDAIGPGVVGELITEGVIGGAGAVVVFLPQILLLFFFVGLMEDSGYMARVAFLMDRIMRSMGLHGRAFVPMLSGFACAVPAILATRTMERQRDRLLTMLVVPLMTCSARLPVYTLIISALFSPDDSVAGIPVQSGLMVAMYLFSVLVSLGAAFVLSKTVLRAPASALIMELPPYRLPRLPDVARMMGMKTGSFLKEAGTVIVGCSIVLWTLLNFPRHEPITESAVRAPATIASAAANALSESESEAEAEGAANAQSTAALRDSYGGRLGRAIEPVLAPLGFDWKMGVGIIGAFAAREVFVATMGVVYNVGEDVDENDAGLRDKLRNERRADGSPVYTPLVGLSLLVFFALACQCVSTLAVVKRETHGYRWPVFLFVYMTGLAWLTSFAVYQGGRALGFA